MTEQNNPEETNNLPEMTPGSNGMYSISAADGIAMGPKLLQAFMEKLREAADKADLEVKVEPLRGILLIWWYPKGEDMVVEAPLATFLEDLVLQIEVVTEGSVEVPQEQVYDENIQTYEQVVEYLKSVSFAKQNRITIKPTQDVLEKDYFHISWGPTPPAAGNPEGMGVDSKSLEAHVEKMFGYGVNKYVVPRTNLIPSDSGYDELGAVFYKACTKRALTGSMELHSETELITFEWAPTNPDEVKEQSYLDAVLKQISETPKGRTKADKELMLSSGFNTMTELLVEFEMFGEEEQKQIRLVHSGDDSEFIISWSPLSDANAEWDFDSSNGTPDEDPLSEFFDPKA